MTGEGITLGQALADFRRANGLLGDEAATWSCRLGPVTLRLPNFRWRRRAILRHDLHHVMTGYPCSLPGEFQMATWEFAAGRFPHAAATLFCLPLVAAGLLWSPRAIWSAFRAGRRMHSLYKADDTAGLLARPLVSLRADATPPSAAAVLRDALAFAFLALWAVSLLLVPALPVVAWALFA